MIVRKVVQSCPVLQYELFLSGNECPFLSTSTETKYIRYIAIDMESGHGAHHSLLFFIYEFTSRISTIFL